MPSERTIVAADQVTRRLVPGEGFRHLTDDPFGNRRAGHSDPDRPSQSVTKNHQTVERLERDVRTANRSIEAISTT
jgi:hypothetical protein